MEMDTPVGGVQPPDAAFVGKSCCWATTSLDHSMLTKSGAFLDIVRHFVVLPALFVASVLRTFWEQAFSEDAPILGLSITLFLLGLAQYLFSAVTEHGTRIVRRRFQCETRDAGRHFRRLLHRAHLQQQGFLLAEMRQVRWGYLGLCLVYVTTVVFALAGAITTLERGGLELDGVFTLLCFLVGAHAVAGTVYTALAMHQHGSLPCRQYPLVDEDDTVAFWWFYRANALFGHPRSRSTARVPCSCQWLEPPLGMRQAQAESSARPHADAEAPRQQQHAETHRQPQSRYAKPVDAEPTHQDASSPQEPQPQPSHDNPSQQYAAPASSAQSHQVPPATTSFTYKPAPATGGSPGVYATSSQPVARTVVHADPQPQRISPAPGSVRYQNPQRLPSPVSPRVNASARPAKSRDTTPVSTAKSSRQKRIRKHPASVRGTRYSPYMY